LRRGAKILTALVNSFGIAEENHQLATFSGYAGRTRQVLGQRLVPPSFLAGFSHHTGHSPLNAYNPRTLHPTPAERHGTLPGYARVPAAATGLRQSGSLLGGAPSNKTSDRKVRWPT